MDKFVALSKSNNIDDLKALLKEYDVNTLLYYAITYSDDLIKFLLDNKAELQYETLNTICIAAHPNPNLNNDEYTRVLQLLVDNKVNIHVDDLSLAKHTCMNNKIGIINIILQHTSNIDILDFILPRTMNRVITYNALKAGGDPGNAHVNRFNKDIWKNFLYLLDLSLICDISKSRADMELFNKNKLMYNEVLQLLNINLNIHLAKIVVEYSKYYNSVSAELGMYSNPED